MSSNDAWPTKEKIPGGQQEHSGSFRGILGWKKNKNIKHIYKYFFWQTSHLKAREAILNIFYKLRVKKLNWEFMTFYQVNITLSMCPNLSSLKQLNSANSYHCTKCIICARLCSEFLMYIISFIFTTICAWDNVLAMLQVKNPKPTKVNFTQDKQI